MVSQFKALVVDRKEGESLYSQQVAERHLDDLPAGDLLVRVNYSSLNFKDALSAKGNKGVTRQYPHTPGVDAAGVVEFSGSDLFAAGDEVIVTGYDLGMNTSGGFSQYVRIPAEWAVPLPRGLDLRQAMVLGTAGLTAALCVDKLLNVGLKPDLGEVFVSGATGGVGSISVALLAKLGFDVAASTGKLEMVDRLIHLGAKNVVDRDTISEGVDRPMLKETWAGAIDTVGGDILFNIVKSLKYGGSVACCGMVASPNFQANVFPFILRGVNLLGVDSVEQPIELKQAMWQRLAGEWKLDCLDSVVKEISLEELPQAIDMIFRGKAVGRILVRVD
ncbi:YhdH/YhfP family quinone oxidoreductase [Aestuariirhabdus sp. Z084]|uniref:YhdH/YhfP family quinone oxidoreductase n=1 Tax=Aestuariirhabdus haliotis TaxID=2918751 RepID=UPI00201B45A8|nr:YhdH/YhfP family quinone oxidoreductase [Aestuariirhabdus haliotis]MCL6414588.1 YhdH/YhfP family quinone oxidoreductase [Aestuariirhabdus haliotis]MCL6418430.1 YhdH/YhfP family quinone oxidoreductase [Aestuariirhabdus haliotis]